MMNRRAFLASFALGLLAAPPSGKAQPERVFRVGWIAPPPPNPYQEIILGGLRSLGYVEGRNLVFYRQVGEPQDLPAMANELVRMNVEVIYAGASSGVRAAYGATREVPIVGVDLETDPLASRMIASLARPGGNLTGFFLDLPEFSAKRLELLKEALPTVSRVMVLWDSSLDPAPLSRLDSAAHALKLRLTKSEVRTVPDIENAFQAAADRKAQAVMIMQSPTLDGYKDQILEFGRKHRLPVFAMFANFAIGGAVLSYGPNVADMIARATTYVDKILRGARPGDLPVQRPTKFDLFVNLKAAKSLGLSITNSVLVRADEVIH
jgi:putative ABC transport system substrate-binding protein